MIYNSIKHILKINRVKRFPLLFDFASFSHEPYSDSIFAYGLKSSVSSYSTSSFISRISKSLYFVVTGFEATFSLPSCSLLILIVVAGESISLFTMVVEVVMVLSSDPEISLTKMYFY